MNLAEQIASLKGATILNIGGVITKDQTAIRVLSILLTDGRKIELSSYTTFHGNEFWPSETAMDLSITE